MSACNITLYVSMKLPRIYDEFYNPLTVKVTLVPQ